jgi:hypothetical protein
MSLSVWPAARKSSAPTFAPPPPDGRYTYATLAPIRFNAAPIRSIASRTGSFNMTSESKTT